MAPHDPVPDGVNRRRFLRVASATGALATVGSASAADGPEGNPLAGFGGTQCDTARTSDEYLPFDTDGAYGGWGGHAYHGTRPGTRQNPVVFVHGNTHDGCDFSIHAEAYLERGYRGDELWSITFREGTSTHAEMARQLDDFVAKVRRETGAGTVDVVSHSLGVTGVRFWLCDLRPMLDRWPSVALSADHPAAEPHFTVVDAFVGLAGANHGTATCGPCEKGSGSAEPCNVISPLCADDPGEPLFDLNHHGSDCTDPASACEPNETPGDVAYYTIRGGLDYFYPTNPESPELAGATNVLLPARAHNATRASATALELVYQWVTEDEHRERERTVPVAARGERSDDGSVFLAGGTDVVELTVEADRPTLLRDRIPYEWDVLDVEGDDVEAVAVRPHEGVKEVYLGGSPSRTHDVTYVVEAPDRSGSYEFGPVEVRAPAATEWETVPDTTERNVVL